MLSRRMLAGTLAFALAASLATFCAFTPRAAKAAPEGCVSVLEEPRGPVAMAVEGELVREPVLPTPLPHPEPVPATVASNLGFFTEAIAAAKGSGWGKDFNVDEALFDDLQRLESGVKQNGGLLGPLPVDPPTTETIELPGMLITLPR